MQWRIYTNTVVHYKISTTGSILIVTYCSDIVHRDLKLENILLARNPANPEDEMYVKVADFGLSTVKRGVTYTDMLKDQCGTLVYMCKSLLHIKTRL